MPGSVPLSQPRSFTGWFGAVLAVALLGAGACALHGPVLAQAQPVLQPQMAPAASGAASAAVSRPAVPRMAASAAKSNSKRVTKPLWSELAPPQQQALAPLAGTWDTVSEAQKRKWLAMSQNYPKLSGDEQAKLHSRMIEWAALSPQQRTEARLTFGETKKLSPDDKKAKWEAYQALPAEEKRKLAASAPKAPATAAAVKPVPPEKLTDVPKPKPVAKGPRIAATPGQVNHNTLLPRASPASSAGPAN